MTLNLRRTKRSRVIDRLRKKYPGKWTYNRDRRVWEHEGGWYVYSCAALTQSYDCDDNTFTTLYYRSDTRELVWFF